jgi:hypothetical protein
VSFGQPMPKGADMAVPRRRTHRATRHTHAAVSAAQSARLERVGSGWWSALGGGCPPIEAVITVRGIHDK